MRSLHFLYHELRTSRSRYSYVTPCEEFEAHCAMFSRVRKAPAEGVLRPEVTFDDGHQSDIEYALPILAKHKLTATFFITVGWTGQRQGFMTWPQLRELHAAGHRVGAHGMTHQLLTSCSTMQLDTELRAARTQLEDGLGTVVNLMSLPGGRANARVFRACEQAGFEQIFTSVPQAQDMDTRPRRVGRLNLLSGTSVDRLDRLLDTHSHALAKLEQQAKVKDVAQQVLGDRLYARLWAIANRQEKETVQAGASLP